MGQLRQRIFGIPCEEATFERRGFTVHSEAAKRHLEEVGYAFLEGYHAALLTDDLAELEAILTDLPLELQGFGFEGAAMGVVLSDALSVRKRRFEDFVDGPGRLHIYMIHVGAGWAFARLPGRVMPRLRRLHPLYRWLAVDGYGFHQGYFHWPVYVDRQRRPKRLAGYALRAFDQGLGRSLWFVRGAKPDAIADAIALFEAERHADLWSGVGLACAYAGGTDQEDVRRLVELASTHRAPLAQGAAFAAEARRRAGNPTKHTAVACELLCGTSAALAAEVTQKTLNHLPFDDDLPAYEHWRMRIQKSLYSTPQSAAVALNA